MEIKLTDKNPYWMYFCYPVKTSGQRGVECIIKQEGEEIATSLVYCHTTDKFVKETGRIKAIEKVMEILQLSRKERTEFYRQYFNRTNSVKLEINITKINNKVEFLQQLTKLIQSYGG